jgi:hypothetical protein
MEHNAGCGIPVIELSDIRSDVFTQVLQFIYTNDCSLLQTGECPIKWVTLVTYNFFIAAPAYILSLPSSGVTYTKRRGIFGFDTGFIGHAAYNS